MGSLAPSWVPLQQFGQTQQGPFMDGGTRGHLVTQGLAFPLPLCPPVLSVFSCPGHQSSHILQPPGLDFPCQCLEGTHSAPHSPSLNTCHPGCMLRHTVLVSVSMSCGQGPTAMCGDTWPPTQSLSEPTSHPLLRTPQRKVRNPVLQPHCLCGAQKP